MDAGRDARVDVVAAVGANVEADVAAVATVGTEAAAKADAIKLLVKADARVDASKRRQSELQGGLRKRPRKRQCNDSSMNAMAMLYRRLVLM